MARPTVVVDLDKVRQNAAAIVQFCDGHGIEVSGVTKAVWGDPHVAEAMLQGGVVSIGESRLDNVLRLRAAGLDAQVMLLRVPAPSEAEEVVNLVDVSLNSEIDVASRLSEAAVRAGRVLDVILMVDVGDLREGVWPDRLPVLARAVHELPGAGLAGIGANLTCFAGVVPSRENMGLLVDCAEAVEQTIGTELRWVSGGNSSALPLIAGGDMPDRVNHLRVGEAILLGRETVRRQPWPGTHQDAFELRAEVVECAEKPSAPVGEVTQDAFGRRPSLVDRAEDHGTIRRALVAVGRADVDVDALAPVDERRQILGASSDYTIVDVGAADPAQVGDVLRFRLGYAALVTAMGSPSVDVRYA